MIFVKILGEEPSVVHIFGIRESELGQSVSRNTTDILLRGEILTEDEARQIISEKSLKFTGQTTVYIDSEDRSFEVLSRLVTTNRLSLPHGYLKNSRALTQGADAIGVSAFARPHWQEERRKGESLTKSEVLKLRRLVCLKLQGELGASIQFTSRDCKKWLKYIKKRDVPAFAEELNVSKRLIERFLATQETERKFYVNTLTEKEKEAKIQALRNAIYH